MFSAISLWVTVVVSLLLVISCSDGVSDAGGKGGVGESDQVLDVQVLYSLKPIAVVVLRKEVNGSFREIDSAGERGALGRARERISISDLGLFNEDYVEGVLVLVSLDGVETHDNKEVVFQVLSVIDGMAVIDTGEVTASVEVDSFVSAFKKRRGLEM